jgi:O-antigen/teichoic acid export membrane protein
MTTQESSLGKIAWLSGGLSLTGGAIVQAVVGLGAQIVLMRLLLPDEFGDFALVLAAASLAQVVLSFRLNFLIIRVSDAELTESRRERYKAALVWETAAAAAVTLIWLIISGLLSGYALILVMALAIGQWTNQCAAFFERTFAYRKIVAVETGSQIIGHVCAVALVLTGGGAAALYLRELIVVLARLGIFARVGALSWPRFRLPRWFELRALAIESRALWTDGVLEGGFSRVIVLAAASLGGAHGAGIFSQSLRLAIVPHQMVSPVAARMSGNLFSRIEYASLRRRLLSRMALATLAVLLVAAVITVVFSDPFIPRWLGEHWRPAISTIIAMVGVIMFMSSFELMRAYCVSQRRMCLVLSARVLQYVVFLAGCVMASGTQDPIPLLAGFLSLAYAAAFGWIATRLAVTWPSSAQPEAR